MHRISNRLGLVRGKTREETEHALERVLPQRYWIDINDLLVTLGPARLPPDLAAVFDLSPRRSLSAARRDTIALANDPSRNDLGAENFN